MHIDCLIVLGAEPSEQCQFGEYHIQGFDIGNQQLTFSEVGTGNQFKAFRINQTQPLLPNDGHWRTHDDPEIGSGLVIRTQNQYTVVVIYSYDEQGKPEWKIASGQFDENGSFIAELLKPFGGSSIQNDEPVSAQLHSDVQTIQIQLQGTELATISIDGSEPKVIQNFNFGVEVFSTDQYTVNDGSFNYPDQEGDWLMVSEDLQESRVVNLSYYDPNWYQSPPNPSYYGARSYQLQGSEPDFDFNCRKITRYQAYDNQWYDLLEIPYCTGRYFNRPVSKLTLGYFQDIGYKGFRVYAKEWFEGITYEGITRESSYYDFYRLD